MIWLTWRQFRGQALTALAVLVALATYLLILGLAIRHSYDVTIADCAATNSCSAAKRAFRDQYVDWFSLSGGLLIILPAVIGTFWGAPLITRELETGTHRLVWNQSVTRTRWLAAKLAVIALASLALTGALSILLTWAASPYDELLGNRFTAMDFAARNIAPLGYAVFAFVLGTAVGLIVRRTLPAMALTLAIFAAVQVLVPNVVRPHLQEPVTDTVTFGPTTLERTDGLQVTPDDKAVQLVGYSVPGALMLSSVSKLLNADGAPATREQLDVCLMGNPFKDSACLTKQDLHFTVSYHPADRYWTFQWLELAAFLVLAGLLAGFGFWRIPRGFS